MLLQRNCLDISQGEKGGDYSLIFKIFEGTFEIFFLQENLNTLNWLRLSQ